MLSTYCKNFADEYGIKFGDVKILIPHLSNKINMYFITEILPSVAWGVLLGPPAIKSKLQMKD